MRIHRVQCNILKEIKKGDWLLLAVFLLLAAGIGLSPWIPQIQQVQNKLQSLTFGNSNDIDDSNDLNDLNGLNDIIEIRIAGKVYGSYPLSEDQTISVDTEYGHNVVVIQGGFASVAEADCSNQVCVDAGSIHTPGQMIVCLPHRMTVEILSGNNTTTDDSTGNSEGYDAIVR